MEDTNLINSLVGRSLAGAFAGSAFGAWAHLIFFGDGLSSDDGIRRLFPWQGALIGALLVGAVSIVVGRRELPNWLRKVAIGFLTGCVVGVLAGAFVYAPIMMAGKDPAFGDKMGYRSTGVLTGAILGATVGLLIQLRLRRKP